MDQAGIDCSLVISTHTSAFPDLSTEQAIEITKDFPRLKVIGNVHFGAIDQNQIKLLEDLLEDGKIIGLKFFPGYENYFPNEERLTPLMEFCQKNNKPVVFHTGVLETGFKGLLKQTHPLNIDGLAVRYPDLKIVMAHFGNPWIVDATMVAMKNENVYVDLSGYFGPTIPKADVKFFKHDLKYLSGFLGGYKKCLFGTDWPISRQKEYLAAVKQLPLNAEEKDLVLWKNAKEIYGLEIYR
jgi:predicted TIM-barrel fold metal-dependent hydrolase